MNPTEEVYTETFLTEFNSSAFFEACKTSVAGKYAWITTECRETGTRFKIAEDWSNFT